MTTRFGLRSRLAAIAGALAVGLVGFVAAPAAHADSVGDIDASQTSSIIVHKRSQPQTAGAPATGEVNASPAGDPINGVEFTVYRVENYDLGTPAGWTAAQPVINGFTSGAVDNKTAPTKITISSTEYNVAQVGTPQTTAGEGVATFANLPLGLYLVVESNLNTSTSGAVLPAAPFLVTTPYHSAADKPWIYDVNVYPKNTVTNISKTVTKQDNEIGKEVEFTVTATVPAVTGGDTLDSYKIVDTLDSRLAYKSVKNVTINSAPATVTTDYTVDVSDQTVTVNFNNPNTLVGQEVSFVIVTEVTRPGNGTIPNKVTPYINENEGKSSESTQTVDWGQLKIFKYATIDGAEHGLKGAKFELYTDAAATTDKVETGDLVTNENGVITIPVLKAGTYYLKETEAPAGYTKLTDPIQVTVTAGETEEASLKNYTKVENTKQTVPGLPNTGANGALYLTIGGISLLALAAGGFLISWSRKRKQS